MINQMTKKDKEILKKALSTLRGMRKLFLKEGVWIKGNYGLDIGGLDIHPESKEAAKFCLIGGKRHVGDDQENEKPESKLVILLLASCLPKKKSLITLETLLDLDVPDSLELEGELIGYNDKERRKKSDILSLIDRAIEKAKNFKGFGI